MANRHHTVILAQIKANSGKATQPTFLDRYLGTDSPRYPISIPALRAIAKAWMKEHTAMTARELSSVVTALIRGESSTEKTLAGILLDYATPEQRRFDPVVFETWLNHLTGWAEVDALCSGKYSVSEIPASLPVWKKILSRLARNKNIHHRRASLVLPIAPLRAGPNEQLAQIGLNAVVLLKTEKEILITKAISWLLRSLIKHHRGLVMDFLEKHHATLPAIAVRETRIKLKTGRKNKPRPRLPAL